MRASAVCVCVIQTNVRPATGLQLTRRIVKSAPEGPTSRNLTRLTVCRAWEPRWTHALTVLCWNRSVKVSHSSTHFVFIRGSVYMYFVGVFNFIFLLPIIGHLFLNCPYFVLLTLSDLSIFSCIILNCPYWVISFWFVHSRLSITCPWRVIYIWLVNIQFTQLCLSDLLILTCLFLCPCLVLFLICSCSIGSCLPRSCWGVVLFD